MTERVRLTRRCNNRCIFCPPHLACDDGDERDDEDPATILQQLRELRGGGARRVVLTGGEPTVAVGLSLAVAAARSLGFAEIAITTNARRLADAPYAERLARGGLTHALVSLQSHRADVHDALTRTPGSFAEATDGMLALQRRGVHVTAVLVLTRRNVGELRAYVDLVRALGARAVILRTLRAPAAGGDAAGLGLRPLEIAAAVKAALTHGAAQGLRMTSMGIPRAALAGDLRYYH